MEKQKIEMFVEECKLCDLNFKVTGHSEKQVARRLNMHQQSKHCLKNRK